MPALVLTYFDIDGSRGEAARLAMHIGGIPFEDRRVKRADWQATLADEIMDAVEDAAKKSAREALVAGPLPRFLEQFEARLERGGGEWFVENRLTVADLKCYLWVRWLKSGVLDYIPADLVDRHAPLLAKHMERVQDHPKIAAYYAARK